MSENIELMMPIKVTPYDHQKNWDQRQDPVGTYREYASASTVVTAGATVSVYARFYVGRVSLAHDAEINSSFRALEPPPPVSDIATVALGKTTSYETQI